MMGDPEQGCRGLNLPPADGGTLDETAETALREALLREYVNGLYYEAMIETFGSSRKLNHLARAQKRRAKALLRLFNRYGIEPPARDQAVVPALSATLQESVQVAVEQIEANVSSYDEVLKSELPADVEFVFTNLRNANEHHHLSCLKRKMR